MVGGGHRMMMSGQGSTQIGHPAGSGANGGWVSKIPALFVQSHIGCGQALASVHGGQVVLVNSTNGSKISVSALQFP